MGKWLSTVSGRGSTSLTDPVVALDVKFSDPFLFKFWATATNLKKGFGRAGLGTGVGPGSATAVAISPASSRLRSTVRLRSIELLRYVASICFIRQSVAPMYTSDSTTDFSKIIVYYFLKC